MNIDFTDRNIKNSIDQIKIWPYIEYDFINKKSLNQILSWLETNEYKFGKLGKKDGVEYWKGRSIFYHDVDDQNVKEILFSCNRRITNKIENIVLQNLKIDTRVYNCYLGFARWPSGYELIPHADSENSNGEVHSFYYRNFASIIYLNSDFEGGEIYFPNLGIELKPSPGTMITFPGTLNYLHGVKKIKEGFRHTIAMFSTFDSNKHNGL